MSLFKSKNDYVTHRADVMVSGHYYGSQQWRRAKYRAIKKLRRDLRNPHSQEFKLWKKIASYPRR